MEHMLELLDLRNLLHDIFFITEDVKEVLKKNCDEAAFVLKPWRMKIAFKEQKDESIYNYKKERRKHNVPQNKFLKKSPIETIYSSSSMSVSNHKKMLRKDVAIQKINIAKTLDSKNSVELKSDKMVAMRKSTSPNPISDAKQSNSTSKIQLKMSTKVAVNSKRERNFILENKLNIKKVIPPSKPQDHVHDPNNTSAALRKSLPLITSTAELSNLTYKMAQQSIHNALISLHEDDEHQVVQECVVMMNITEALQCFDIPNDIIRVLRIYYRFLKTEIYKLEKNKRNRYEESVDIFLQEFEATNTFVQNHPRREHRLIDVVTESLSLLDMILSGNLDLIQVNAIKNAIVKSRVVLEQYNIENIVEPIVESSSDLPYLSLEKGWTSYGIWNISYMRHFKNFSKTYNMRYNDKKQLLSLCEAMQELQRSEYLNILIQFILRNVIPATKSTIALTKADYARAYKTIFVLQQGLNPEMPVLVRTDN